MWRKVAITLIVTISLVFLYLGPLAKIRNQIFYSLVDETQIQNSKHISTYKLNNHNLVYSFYIGNNEVEKYSVKSPFGATFMFSIIFITFLGKYKYLSLLIAMEVGTIIIAIGLFTLGLQTLPFLFILSWMTIRYINPLITLGTPVLAYISSKNSKQSRTFVDD